MKLNRLSGGKLPTSKVRNHVKNLTDLSVDPPSKIQEMRFYTELSREGLSIKDRKIYLPEVDIDLPMVLGEFLDLMIALSPEEVKYDPVELIIASYGGESYGMLGAVDIMRSSPLKIDTTVIGAALSAGAWIAAAGTGTRRIYKSAYFMIHQLRGGQQGTMEEMTQTTAHFKKLQKESELILAQFTKKDEKFWRSVCKKDTYINAEKALEYGLVDEIIPWKV